MTKFVGLDSVALYSNYLVIINMINSFTNIIYNAITSSLGNLIATESTEKKFSVFKIMDFVGFVIYGFCSLCLLNVFNPFIKIWAGEQYVFPIIIVQIIVLNFYMTGMRVPLGTIKAAAGIYSQDKYIPLLQALINIVVSIILARFFGVLGVLIGTIVSNMLPLLHRPYIVYKYIFKTKPYKYYITYLKYISTFIFTAFISNILIHFSYIQNELINIGIRLGISIITYALVVLLVYRKTYEYNYIIDKIKEMYSKIRNGRKIS